MVDGARLGLARAVLQGEGVLFVTPIQTNPGLRLGQEPAGRGLGTRIIADYICVHDRLGFGKDAGRSLYSARRWTSSPEYAYLRLGCGSGRKIALCSSNEQVSYSYRSPTQSIFQESFLGANNLIIDASRRRCSPAEWRSDSGGSCSADEQRRASYTGFQTQCH